MKRVLLLVALLSIPAVYAQLDWSITDLRCGNGVIDQFELCEKDLDNQSKCDVLAQHLGIDMGCFEQHCTCLPKINPVYCGNSRRDFSEMCDAGDEDDKCPLLGEIMGNISLKCNVKTCGCDIVDVPSDYSPAAVEGLINASQTASVCGDKKVERDEDCDPPNTLCTTSSQDAGVCTDKCKCVKPEDLDKPEEPVVEVNETEANVTENVTEQVGNATFNVLPVEEEPEKPGFFKRVWNWLAGLFS